MEIITTKRHNEMERNGMKWNEIEACVCIDDDDDIASKENGDTKR